MFLTSARRYTGYGLVALFSLLSSSDKDCREKAPVLSNYEVVEDEAGPATGNYLVDGDDEENGEETQPGNYVVDGDEGEASSPSEAKKSSSTTKKKEQQEEDEE